MKRLVMYLLLLLISVPVVPANPVVANQENLRKAAQEALSLRERSLERLKNDIEKTIFAMARDGVITGKEMRSLRLSVEIFVSKKKEADRYLRKYKKRTETNLSPSLLKALNIYFKFPMYKDRKGQVSLYFASLTGRDVKVESDFFSLIIYLVVLSFLIFLFLYFLYGASTLFQKIRKRNKNPKIKIN